MIKKHILPVLLVCILGCTTEQETTPSTVLKGAKIYLGNGEELVDGVIIIDNGNITTIGGKDTPIPDYADVIDVTGKYITPGLVDAHVHFSQTGYFDGRPDFLDIRDSIDFVDVQER